MSDVRPDLTPLEQPDAPLQLRPVRRGRLRAPQLVGGLMTMTRSLERLASLALCPHKPCRLAAPVGMPRPRVPGRHAGWI